MSIPSFFKSAWRGDEQPGPIFWVGGVILPLLVLCWVMYETHDLMQLVPYAQQTEERTSYYKSAKLFTLFSTLGLLAYYGFFGAILWKCAPNTRFDSVSYIIRLYALGILVLIAAMVCMILVINIFPALMYSIEGTWRYDGSCECYYAGCYEPFPCMFKIFGQ